MTPNQLKTLVVGLQSALLVGFLLSWIWLNEARASLRDAQSNFQESTRLSGEIIELREMKSIASVKQFTKTLDSASLIQAATHAGIQEWQVVSIRRLDPLLVGEEYQQRDVLLEIQDVLLSDLIQLALKLEEHPSGPKITALTIRNASRSQVSQRSEDAAETWSAMLTLTHLEFIARSSY